MEVSEINSRLKEASDFKNNMSGYMDLITTWFRDVLLYKSTSNETKLIFKEQAAAIVKQSESYTYDAINEILKELVKMKVRISSNVNFELALEMMHLSIRDLLTE